MRGSVEGEWGGEQLRQDDAVCTEPVERGEGRGKRLEHLRVNAPGGAALRTLRLPPPLVPRDWASPPVTTHGECP